MYSGESFLKGYGLLGHEDLWCFVSRERDATPSLSVLHLIYSNSKYSFWCKTSSFLEPPVTLLILLPVSPDAVKGR